MKLEKEQFVCLDCETTGLDTDMDRIIEVAAVTFDLPTNYDSFETLLDPQKNISNESFKIHHISEEMCRGKPLIKDVLPDFLRFVGNRIIVGHGIEFDIEMIVKAAKREGIPTTLQNNRFIDTLRLARHYGQSPTNSLEQLRKHFCIGAEIAHRAMGDCLVNIEVFRRLCFPFKTTDELFTILSKPIYMKEMPLGKHKGRSLKEIPLEYLRWAANKDFDRDLLFSIRTELKRRQRGGSFIQAGNPFQEL